MVGTVKEVHGLSPPSDWICAMLTTHGESARDVIDLACGSGRHARWCAGLGLSVLAVDRNPQHAESLVPFGVQFLEADLEGSEWPLEGQQADVVIVSNYLYRPRLAQISELVAESGLLIYETFGVGNAAFGKPSNPDFLLEASELEITFSDRFDVLETFFGMVSEPKPAIRSRFCGRRRG